MECSLVWVWMISLASRKFFIFFQNLWCQKAFGKPIFLILATLLSSCCWISPCVFEVSAAFILRTLILNLFPAFPPILSTFFPRCVFSILTFSDKRERKADSPPQISSLLRYIVSHWRVIPILSFSPAIPMSLRSRGVLPKRWAITSIVVRFLFSNCIQKTSPVPSGWWRSTSSTIKSSGWALMRYVISCL